MGYDVKIESKKVKEDGWEGCGVDRQSQLS